MEWNKINPRIGKREGNKFGVLINTVGDPFPLLKNANGMSKTNWFAEEIESQVKNVWIWSSDAVCVYFFVLVFPEILAESMGSAESTRS